MGKYNHTGWIHREDVYDDWDDYEAMKVARYDEQQEYQFHHPLLRESGVDPMAVGTSGNSSEDIRLPTQTPTKGVINFVAKAMDMAADYFQKPGRWITDNYSKQQQKWDEDENTTVMVQQFCLMGALSQIIPFMRKRECTPTMDTTGLTDFQILEFAEAQIVETANSLWKQGEFDFAENYEEEPEKRWHSVPYFNDQQGNNRETILHTLGKTQARLDSRIVKDANAEVSAIVDTLAEKMAWEKGEGNGN